MMERRTSPASQVGHVFDVNVVFFPHNMKSKNEEEDARHFFLPQGLCASYFLPSKKGSQCYA